MRLLAIETSTDACSVALAIDGIIAERFELAPRRHLELLLPMIDELLAGAQLPRTGLDALAFGAGPGAFTGLRIAAACAQGIALAHDLPVVPVSSLAALAQGVAREHQVQLVLPALDARMGEVYWGAYRREAALVRALQPDQVCAPAAVRVPGTGTWIGAGPGWAACNTALRQAVGPLLLAVYADALPHAQDLAALALREFAAGHARPAEQAIPVYLRDRVTQG